MLRAYRVATFFIDRILSSVLLTGISGSTNVTTDRPQRWQNAFPPEKKGQKRISSKENRRQKLSTESQKCTEQNVPNELCRTTNSITVRSFPSAPRALYNLSCQLHRGWRRFSRHMVKIKKIVQNLMDVIKQRKQKSAKIIINRANKHGEREHG